MLPVRQSSFRSVLRRRRAGGLHAVRHPGNRFRDSLAHDSPTSSPSSSEPALAPAAGSAPAES